MSRAEWLVARKELLAKEKEFTRQRDALSAEHRELPMVRVEKDYVFEAPSGWVALRDLFGEHRQLITYHFMFDPSSDEGCKSCSHMMDNSAGSIIHLAARDTAFAVISRAPLEKLERFKKRMGWVFPWVSLFGNDFNYDFHVTLDPEKGDYEYNYSDAKTLLASGKIWYPKGDMPGLSVFLREGDSVSPTRPISAASISRSTPTISLISRRLAARKKANESRGRFTITTNTPCSNKRSPRRERTSETKSRPKGGLRLWYSHN